MTDKADIRAGRLSDEKIASNLADMHPPLTPSESIIDADRCYFCYDAPCTTPRSENANPYRSSQ